MRIALLEDDMEIGSAINQWLENAGHHCHHFTSGKAIVREAARESYDLFLLDWNIPDLSGLDVLKWLRDKQISNVPVIFVTSRDTEADIVGALAAGADDYMIKPLRRSEMLARCAAVVRRIGSKQSEEKPFEMGDFRIDFTNRIIYIADQPVELTDKEYELSVFLFRNIGRLLSRGHISESVWGRTSDVQSRTVDTHVSRIRKKLDFGVKRGVRLTPIYNFGYRLERVGALPPSEFGNAVQ